jgi:Eukaryotic aspartyl protease
MGLGWQGASSENVPPIIDQMVNPSIPFNRQYAKNLVPQQMFAVYLGREDNNEALTDNSEITFGGVNENRFVGNLHYNAQSSDTHNSWEIITVCFLMFLGRLKGDVLVNNQALGLTERAALIDTAVSMLLKT